MTSTDSTPTTTRCTACAQLARLSPTLRCNTHRVESTTAALLRRARAAGYAGVDPLSAEAWLGARPVMAN